MSFISKLLSVCFFLTSFIALGDNSPNPVTKKEKATDTMLFGDVLSNDEHIPFATVAVKGTTAGTAADETGHFKIANLPAGKQTLIFSAIGYRPKEMVVDLTSGKETFLRVNMKEDNLNLEQVVVTADRNQKNRRESSTIVNTLNPKLLESVGSVTLSDGLNFAPGLRMENNCQNCGFTQVRMNGMEGPYSQILINSRPVFSGLAGVYGLELIPSSMIERVEVVRGGGSALYGSNAIAGTINLITKDPIKNSFQVSSNYSLVGAGVDGSDDAAGDYNLSFNASMVTENFKSGMTVFGFTRERNPFDANNDSFSEISELNNTSVGMRAFHRTGKRSKLTLDYFNINEERRGGNDFDKLYHEADIAEAVTHELNTGAITWELLTGESNKFSVFASGQSIDRDSYYGANQDLSAYGKTKDLTFSVGTQYNHNFDKLIFAPSNLTVGIENNGGSLEDKKLGYYDVDEDLHMPNTLVADQTTNTLGVFAQNEWSWLGFKLGIGLRYDYYKVSDKEHKGADVDGTVISPRFNMMYDVARNLQVRASYSRGYRAPQIFDEDLHIETSGARKVLHENAEDLEQENSHSTMLSFNWTPEFGTWQTEFLAEGFYTKLDNPFSSAPEPGENEGEIIFVRENAKGAFVKGINLEFNAAPSRKFSLSLGYTHQISEYEDPQEEFSEKSFFRTPKDYGYFNLNWNPVPELTISSTGNFTGEMLVPYYGPEAPVDPDSGEVIGELRTSGSFFDLGTKVSYLFRFNGGVNMETSVGVKNIFNSYQEDFDSGEYRDPAYLYGPLCPRTITFGLKFSNLF